MAHGCEVADLRLMTLLPCLSSDRSTLSRGDCKAQKNCLYHGAMKQEKGHLQGHASPVTKGLPTRPGPKGTTLGALYCKG